MKEIFERRSVRKYTNEPVSDEEITQLLKAAMRAPSASNQQAWEFIVIRDKNILLEITKFHPHAQMLDGAACAIVVCGNKAYTKSDYDFWVQDCSAATQNLLLEAVYLYLGAVWLSCYPNEERVKKLTKLLNLPEDVIPLNIISIGHPAEIPEPIDTFKEDRIHYNKW